jgi:hypothetical protein
MKGILFASIIAGWFAIAIVLMAILRAKGH